MNTQIFFWPRAEQIPPFPLGDVHNRVRSEVHIYAWDLDLPVLPLDWKILSEEETGRARRFVFPQDRDRYVRAHSAMRTLLGSYIGIPPGKVLFSSNPYGKPQIQLQQNSESIRFSLSHSAGIAVLGVARGYEIGIDLEMVRPIDRDVAEHHFSRRELLTLQSLSSEEWLQGFYRCWTGKEALLKGEGLGLNLPLDAFDVEAHPQRPAALLDLRPQAGIAPGWMLIELKPAHNAVGTLAVLDRTGKFAADAVQCFSLNS